MYRSYSWSELWYPRQGQKETHRSHRLSNGLLDGVRSLLHTHHLRSCVAHFSLNQAVSMSAFRLCRHLSPQIPVSGANLPRMNGECGEPRVRAVYSPGERRLELAITGCVSL